MNENKIRYVFKQFEIQDQLINAIPFGNGHINETYLVQTNDREYILQRINHHVFRDVDGMNQNIIRVLDHITEKQRQAVAHLFLPLKIFYTRDQKNHFRDQDDMFWRLMNYIPNSKSFDVAKEPNVAFQAAKAYGYFQKMIIDLDPVDFIQVIPDFHNLAYRMDLFEKALKNDSVDRAKEIKDEIDFTFARKHLVKRLSELLRSGSVPVRVTHNDTKINNALLHRETLQPMAVVDLDTVMPGTVLYDFGDMIRTFTSPADEDETDLDKIDLREDIFQALAKGYLSELQTELKQDELDHLVFGGEVMTFMIGLRFLTDFINGDTYYKTSRPLHNLDRCRTQYRLLSLIEKKKEDLSGMLKSLMIE